MTRRLRRTLRWLFVCALLALPLALPAVEPLSDVIELVAEAGSTPAVAVDAALDIARRPPALYPRVASVAPRTRSDAGRVPIYLLHRSLLL
jgi:hypothetical protein